VAYRDKDVERSCLTRRALKVAAGFQRENHLMNRGRRDIEVPLDVRFRRRAAVDLLVVVDESQVRLWRTVNSFGLIRVMGI